MASKMEKQDSHKNIDSMYQKLSGSQPAFSFSKDQKGAEVRILSNPEEICRNLFLALPLGDDVLPALKSIEIYHVRCLAYGQENGRDIQYVYFPPEFLYLFDFGYPSLSAILINSSIAGLGDPEFPNFKNASFRSVKSRDPNDLIFPMITSQIVIGTKKEISQLDLSKLLSQYVENIQGTGTFFTGSCKPFHEIDICEKIEKTVEVVKYASPNHIIRIIDIIPGWQVDKVI